MIELDKRRLSVIAMFKAIHNSGAVESQHHQRGDLRTAIELVDLLDELLTKHEATIL